MEKIMVELYIDIKKIRVKLISFLIYNYYIIIREKIKSS